MGKARASLHLRFAASVAAVLSYLPGAAFGQAPIPGYPTSIYALDSREVAMLPRYCIHTQHFREKAAGGNNPAEIQRWSAVMGETYLHMHHYCYGLMDLNRATILARDAQARRFYLDNAIKEFDYVLERAAHDFVLLPEVFTKKGETLVRQGRGQVAVGLFEKAVELKPDYWPPYAHLSDYYKSAGEMAKAREMLERGLSAIPDTKALQRRLAELDRSPAARKNGAPGERKRGSAPAQ